MNTKKILVLALAFVASAAVFAAGAPRPDVRRLNDPAQRLRSSPAASASVIASLSKGEPLLVLEVGTKRDSADGRAGVWVKVRTGKAQEGYVISTALDKPRSGAFTRADFSSDDEYGKYLVMAMRRGERVVAVAEYERIQKGDEGWFCSVGDGDPPYLVVWDRDLEATPMDDALDDQLPRILEDRVYFVYPENIEILPQDGVADFSELALDWARERSGEFIEGAEVSLGAHLAVSSDEGSTNWNDQMAGYVGERAVITEVVGDDSYGRPVVRVDIDEGKWVWRIENMRLESPSSGESYYEAADESYEQYPVEDATEHYGQIKVGSVVVLGRHDAVDGNTNWSSDMEKFVGKAAKVTSLSGADSAGCLGVRVEGNTFFWRVRNLALRGRGEAGGYGFVVGDKVILGRHRSINGDENWSVSMDEYVGEVATITELIGPEDSEARCYLVYVDIDNGDFVWRVENMELP